jgi:hypothetical protein
MNCCETVLCDLNYDIGTGCIYWTSKIENRLNFIGDIFLTSYRDFMYALWRDNMLCVYYWDAWSFLGL